jgi:hypothetical protein
MFDEPPRHGAWTHNGARGGFEVVFIASTARRWEFDGHTAAVEDGRPWGVRYRITVDRHWRTRSARVWTSTEGGVTRCSLLHDGAGRWTVDGERAPHLDGCLDVDLEASACTNAFPAHRFAADVDLISDAPAAYVRVGGEVERLEQTYRPRAPSSDGQSFDYAAPQFEFACRLDYDRSGLVVEYPGIATREL